MTLTGDAASGVTSTTTVCVAAAQEVTAPTTIQPDMKLTSQVHIYPFKPANFQSYVLFLYGWSPD